jgi:hypothetical protein
MPLEVEIDLRNIVFDLFPHCFLPASMGILDYVITYGAGRFEAATGSATVEFIRQQYLKILDGVEQTESEWGILGLNEICWQMDSDK